MAPIDPEERLKLLETEIERRLAERFAALREEFDRLRLESDRRWFGFLERFDQDLKGVVPSELLSGESAKVVERKGMIGIDAARSLDQAATQVDVLHHFLDQCRAYCSRAALLVSRGGAIAVWKAVGFSSHGVEDEAVRQISLPPAEGGLVARVMSGVALRLHSSNEMSSVLRAARVADGVAIPMVVREKISGALYADAIVGEEERFDPDALALLTFVTGLLVDRLASRKLKPAPALRPLEAAKRSEPAGMWMEAEAAETPAAEAEAAPPPIAPPPPASSRAEERPGSEASLAAPESLAGPTPEPVRRLAGPLAEPAAGDERREEARRFARLLVSEIKLYNERAVLEGREHGNLYERLRDDIDRSRQMYEDRIPKDVRDDSNFFYEELVEILADGRPDALGL
ncbi:MAG: hypothetical protein ACM3NW_12995 [Syntrophomonadaceae bacterium]